ncbi:hypothetical protein [Pseudomonas aeruginosa]|uniref:hypothetical protein n=1 Tax=Pseudomonas aeruginosa TaxID=287 RepID=UPI003D03B25A
MKQAIIVGEGRALERADSTAWARGLEHRVLELNAADRHNFDIAPLLERYPAAESEVFVALDERAVNYARHKLIADIRLAGYRLFDIVSPQAIVGEGVRLLGNVFVGAGCVLAGPARIGTGSWLELQVLVEEDCRVGTCSTLLAGVQLDGEWRSARAARWVRAASRSPTPGWGDTANGCCRAGFPGNCLITPFTMNSCPMGHASYERGAVDDGGKRYDAGGLPFAMRTERISIGVGAYFLSWRGVPLTGGCRFVAASAWGSPDCCGRCAFRQQ